MTTTKTTALIDADMIVYKVASVVEQATDWGDGLWTLHADEDEAVDRLIAEFSRLTDAAEADDMVACFSDPSGRYWRHDIYPDYKGNREGKRKPLVFNVLREHVTDHYTAYIRPGLEADDILGILSTNKKVIKGRKVIISADKDFKTIPGFFLDTGKMGQGVREITEAEANYFHMYQTLIGDATDNYPGCPGVGPVRAERILEAGGDNPTWAVVVEAFEKAGLSEEQALLQARIARICRACDYNFKKKEVKLWQPS